LIHSFLSRTRSADERRPTGPRGRRGASLVAVALSAATSLAGGDAAAQFGPFGVGSPGQAPPAGDPKAAPPTHAASGGDNGANLPKTTVGLPEDPNAIPDVIKKRIGTDADDDGETGRTGETDVDFYGLYVATQPGLTGLHGGPRAVNLGGPGAPPAPADVARILFGADAAA